MIVTVNCSHLVNVTSIWPIFSLTVTIIFSKTSLKLQLHWTIETSFLFNLSTLPLCIPSKVTHGAFY